MAGVARAQSAAPADFDRPVSWRLLVPNIISDQKKIWTLPAKVAEGHHWVPAAAFLGATAAVIALDPVEGGYFRRTTALHGFDSVATSNVTMAGTLAVPAAFFVVGKLRKDTKATRTAWLAAEAVADSEVVATALKYATRRQRPEYFSKNANFADSWFENGPGTGSFPSGHTITAFSVATIIARRYGNHRWVPFVSYGLAGLVGFSRLSLSAHFLSDVAVGGMLGYSISRFAVLRQ